MEPNDRELENFLREFTPRQPRALSSLPADLPINPQGDRLWNWQRLAAAVLLTFVSGACVWFAGTQGTRTTISTAIPTVTSATSATSGEVLSAPVALERMALEDPAQFDAALSAASRNVLPRFNRPDSSLCVLAKE